MQHTQGGAVEVQDFHLRTFSGHLVDLSKGPKENQVNIEDIAHALSNACRFSGSCHRFYSVAEHSIFVARHSAPMYAVYYLLHDASEYLTGDITGPMKRLIWGMDYKNNPEYKKIFDPLDKMIIEGLGLNYIKFKSLYSHIKDVDNRLYSLEKKHLFGSTRIDQFPEDDPMHGCKFGLSPEEAERFFLMEFQRYMM